MRTYFLSRCIATLQLSTVPKVIRTPGYCITSSAQFVQCRLAGHSHWANIRHIKGAKDHEKMLVTQNIAAKVRIALRETGGSNPKMNAALAKVIELAEKNNIPAKAIQAIITKAETQKCEQTVIEAKGPSGSLIILELSSPNFRKTRNDVSRIVAKRLGVGALMSEGGSRHFFQTKGIITVIPESSDPVTLEEATDIAIMVNAEDVQPAVSEDEKECFEVVCEPAMLYQVLGGLRSSVLKVEDYGVKRIPNELVDLSEAEKEIIDDVMQAIGKKDDITIENVFDNIRW